MTPMTLFAAATVRTVSALVLGGILSTNANAVSMGVKLACASDYYSYCSQHQIGSTALRQCMRSHGPQLSGRCVNALITAGEVSKAEVDRRRALAAKKAGSKTAAAKQPSAN